MRLIPWKGGNQEAISDYFTWLCDKVGYDDRYDGLLRYLFDVEFIWRHPMDENREKDGLYLRDKFKKECGVVGNVFMDHPCTILEVMVALSIRIEEDIVGDPDICVFWRMINNLGLTETQDPLNWEARIDIWLERKFDRDGSGSPFPLEHPDCNQSRIEIWAQAMRWINEFMGYT